MLLGKVHEDSLELSFVLIPNQLIPVPSEQLIPQSLHQHVDIRYLILDQLHKYLIQVLGGEFVVPLLIHCELLLDAVVDLNEELCEFRGMRLV